MRVLVLGGSGFLGRYVASALASRGHHVEIAEFLYSRLQEITESLPA